jgi:hypothetical protein
MGYMQDIDRWLDAIFSDLANRRADYASVKRQIRERILDSYHNGVSAGGRSPAPRRPRRFDKNSSRA